MSNLQCDPSKVQAVKNAINTCDHYDDDEDAADCIQN